LSSGIQYPMAAAAGQTFERAAWLPTDETNPATSNHGPWPASLKKRVLIVGYFFVDANMGGVRLRRIARRLPRHGWEPVVLTHPRGAGSVAPTGMDGRVEEVRALDLTRLYARLRGPGRAEQPPAAGRPQPTAKPIVFTSELNRWLMIPDKQLTWYRAALRRGRELLRSEKFSVLFASLEPRTSLLVAARLSKETGIPCVLEYRDLWTGNPYYHVTQPTAWHRWVHRRLERSVLRQAAKVSAVCRGIAEYLGREHAAILNSPVELNYNFFDPDEYAGPEVVPDGSRPFTVSYTGAMYATRSPRPFFEGVRAFLDQAGLSPAQFRFRWAGGASGISDFAEILERTRIGPYLNFLGQIPHREALALLQQSHAALLIQAPDDAIHIPGKLFEAMGARVPLLALSNPCEASEIIHRCRAGLVCAHTAPSVAAALVEFHKLAAAGKRWEFNESEVRQFSAEAAIGRLADMLERASA
jgi:glycosyltransferase involved in cell wall biosynthesis